MKFGDFKSYADLPEEAKKDYKAINKKEDFVKTSAVEDIDVAHRLGVLENEAFGELSESITKSGMTPEQIISKLKDLNLKYDDKKDLQDLLFQCADLSAIQGKPLDTNINEYLEKTHNTLSFSSISRKKISENVQIGDVDVISELLMDEKIWLSWDILDKLQDDDQRLRTFNKCKGRFKAATEIIERVENLDLALNMLGELIESTEKKPSGADDIGRKLANRLFQAGSVDKLIAQAKQNVLGIENCKDFIHLLGAYPEQIISFIKESKDVNAICGALKFVANPQLLLDLVNKKTVFPKLSKEEQDQVMEYAELVAKALNSTPEITPLTRLKNDTPNKYTDENEAKNKFVMGLDKSTGQYNIAWANMDSYEYHRDIFQRLKGNLNLKSGGYISMDNIDGKLVISMTRSSGDYGCYSQETLEHFRGEIKKSLQESLGEQEFELVIQTSTNMYYM